MRFSTDREVALRCGVIAIVIMALLSVQLGSATAGSTGAVSNGNWSSAATWTNGVPGTADNVFIGSNTPAGAAAIATVTLSQNTSAGNVYLGNGSGTSGRLDLSGHNLGGSNLYLGQNGGTGSILRTGGGNALIKGSFNGYGSTFSFAPGDLVGQLNLYNNSTASTSAPGNTTGSVYVDPTSSLSLGADLSPINGNIDLQGTLNANGHAISATDIQLGMNGGPFTLANRGAITANELDVSSQFTPGQTIFNLAAGDTATTLHLFGVSTSFPGGVGVYNLNLSSNNAAPPTYATATTTGNPYHANDISVEAGCMLSLGADLSLNGELDMRGILNANGHAITAQNVFLGYSGNDPATFQNDGLITASGWNQGNGTQVQLREPGDRIRSLVLVGNSALTVMDAAGQTTGLTINGQLTSDLIVNAGSSLELEANGNALGWVLEWANPPGGANHIADLQALINADEITFTYLNGGSYSLSADSSYTYINVIPVPEPSSMLLSLMAAGFFMVRRRRKA